MSSTDDPDVRVHIERLVLDGLPVGPGGAGLVQAALEAELARLITDGGLAGGLSAGGAVPELPPAEMPPAPQAGSAQAGSAPAGLGAGVARAVYARIGS